MRNSNKLITMSVDMYLSNLSSRKMRNQLLRHFNHRISHVSVLDWVRKYVLKVHKFVDRLNPQLNGRIYADETDIPRGTNTKKKGGDIFWCAVDWDTRFINATYYSPKTQSIKDATEFMKRIKSRVLPKYIQTDAGAFYPKAFMKVFNPRRKKFSNLKIQHIVNNVGKTRKHNVRIETVFSKIKDRVDDFRGLKALWSAPILLAGIVLQHNFIESHTTTGQLPCELAGLNLETGINRWLGLIRLSSCGLI
ncbi:DDE-type integrase/transposase/recombinase [Candidatus Woesearchaeota archaeon]|nr:DDE-type integrase/transposase/recombinase [Candidatus Woesearchaeota archaeon]